MPGSFLFEYCRTDDLLQDYVFLGNCIQDYIFPPRGKCLRHLDLNDCTHTNDEVPQRLSLVSILLIIFAAVETHYNCEHTSQ